MHTPLHDATFDTPLGPMRATASTGGVRALEFADAPAAQAAHSDNPHLIQLRDELRAYFAGDRTGFTTPLDLEGTPFQRRVWDRLLAIPYAATISYDRLARDLGDPNATRAVGRANAANPVAIVVPCHRVVNKSGALGGYAGGLDRKRALLDLEHAALITA